MKPYSYFELVRFSKKDFDELLGGEMISSTMRSSCGPMEGSVILSGSGLLIDIAGLLDLLSSDSKRHVALCHLSFT